MTEPATDFDTLVRQCEIDIVLAASTARIWHEVPDFRKAPVTRTEQKRWRRRSTTTTAHPILRLSGNLHSAYTTLIQCRERATRMLSVPDDNLLGQIDAALRQICDYAEAVSNHAAPDTADVAPASDAAVRLAAKIAALVSLAEERERIVCGIDDDTLRSQAEDLLATNAQIRVLLDKPEST